MTETEKDADPSWRKEASWRTRERDGLVKVFKIEGTDFDGSGWRKVRQGHVQHERGCGTVLSAIAKKVVDRVSIRVDSIEDGCIIDGVKRSRHCCATSEMPFGEGMRGKSVRLLTSEEWGGDCVIMVFSDRLWRHG